jgi:hypothetical protein
VGYALGIIGMVLFWAVLVLAIAAAIRYLDRRRHETFPPPPRPPTVSFLDRPWKPAGTAAW